MGAFFANLHVRATGPDVHSRLRNVGESISHHLVEKGYRVVPADADVAPDRTVILSCAPDTPWVAVFDEDSDAPDPSALSDLGGAVSGGTVAIGAIVNDSDTLEISLYQDGRRTERLKYSPGRRPPRLKRSHWESLLQAHFPAFVASFSSESPFAEEPLEELARTLGIDQDSIHLGFHYRDELHSPDRFTLRFVAPEESRYYVARVGPPSFCHFSGVVKPRLLLNTPTDGCGFLAGFYNEGGASRGAAVLLETSQAQDALFLVHGLRLYLDGTLDRTVDSEVVQTSSNNRNFYRAGFPSLELPPWIEATRNLRPAESMRLNNAFQRANIKVQVQGTPVAPGAFHTKMVFVPLANPDGLAAAEFEVTIETKPWW